MEPVKLVDLIVILILQVNIKFAYLMIAQILDKSSHWMELAQLV
jgi:hypothetical protein